MKQSLLLERMDSGQYADFTKEELTFLFDGLKAGHGSIGAESYRGFLTYGPKPLHELFLKEAHALSQAEIASYVSHWPGKYAVLDFGVDEARCRTLRIQDVMPTWNTLVSTSPGANFIFAYCLKCGWQRSLPMIHMWREPPAREPWNLFDLDDRETTRAIYDFARQNLGMPYVEVRAVFALCQHCFRPCACGAELGQRVTSEELSLYMYEGRCFSCGGDSITKLPLPKPSPADLKLYRGKLRTLRMGVKP